MKKEIQIPQELPQFNDNPALIVVSGEYAANFYYAFEGHMKEIDNFELHPKREGRGKHDGMVKSASGTQFEAYAHKERYMEDLKNKFHKKLTEKIHKHFIPNEDYEIILLAPNYCAKKCQEDIKKGGHKEISRVIKGEYTKESMHQILERIKKDILKTLPDIFSEEEQAIMDTPKTKP